MSWPQNTAELPLYTPAFASHEVAVGAFIVSNRVMLFSAGSLECDGRSQRRSDAGAITVRRALDNEFCGMLQYYPLAATALDLDGHEMPEPVLVIRVFGVTVFEGFRGRGICSKMYDELRSSHENFVIGADEELTDTGGRTIATHYREAYPDRHVGRFDTDMVLHYTSGPTDSLYQPPHLLPVRTSSGDAVGPGRHGPTVDHGDDS